MDCAFLICQSKNDAFAGTALLEAPRHGADGVAHVYQGDSVRICVSCNIQTEKYSGPSTGKIGPQILPEK